MRPQIHSRGEGRAIAHCEGAARYNLHRCLGAQAAATGALGSRDLQTRPVVYHCTHGKVPGSHVIEFLLFARFCHFLDLEYAGQCLSHWQTSAF